MPRWPNSARPSTPASCCSPPAPDLARTETTTAKPGEKWEWNARAWSREPGAFDGPLLTRRDTSGARRPVEQGTRRSVCLSAATRPYLTSAAEPGDSTCRKACTSLPSGPATWTFMLRQHREVSVGRPRAPRRPEVAFPGRKRQKDSTLLAAAARCRRSNHHSVTPRPATAECGVGQHPQRHFSNPRAKHPWLPRQCRPRSCRQPGRFGADCRMGLRGGSGRRTSSTNPNARCPNDRLGWRARYRRRTAMRGRSPRVLPQGRRRVTPATARTAPPRTAGR